MSQFLDGFYLLPLKIIPLYLFYKFRNKVLGTGVSFCLTFLSLNLKMWNRNSSITWMVSFSVEAFSLWQKRCGISGIMMRKEFLSHGWPRVWDEGGQPRLASQDVRACCRHDPRLDPRPVSWHWISRQAQRRVKPDILEDSVNSTGL